MECVALVGSAFFFVNGSEKLPADTLKSIGRKRKKE